MAKFEDLIAEGEVAREEGKLDKALSAFDQAIVAAGIDNDWKAVVNTLSHRIIVYLHLFKLTGNKNFLELYWGDTQTALTLIKREKYDNEIKAPLMLRTGQYYGLLGDHTTAASYHTAALNLLPREKDGRYAEYLGFKGYENALAGNKKGLADLKEALNIIHSDETLRPFHKMVVKSGVLMRLAECLYKFRDPAWIDALDEARDLAEKLARKHRMKMRLYEIDALKEKLK